jgi:O-succinylbenzoic acid--CoA ligase
MGGLAPVLRSALYGTVVVIQERFDAERTPAAAREHRATGISLVPTALHRILEAGADLPRSLRFVLLGGAAADESLIAACEDRGVPVYPTYGTTETASQIATATPAEAFAHEGTVGRPLYGTEVRILDDGGNPLPAGETGEIAVAGPTVTPGYLGDDDAAFGPHGLRTGDLGYRDDEGRLFVTGRADDVIVTGGENVSASEVVATLEEHPAVRVAAVVGLDDPEWGERVAALVVTAGEAGDDTAVGEEGLRAFCRERLAGFKTPKTIRITDSLPRTPSGTVDREAVRKRLISR